MTVLGGRYRLVERLGVGGMSVVWRGFDEVLGRQVAVKVLNTKLVANPKFRRRIRVEAQAAARLCHPHITNVYDYGEADSAPYVVMELVDGQSLASMLSGAGALPWQAAVKAGAEVASALAAAHARGIVHRDVTPGNIILAEGGAKVVDFGISALVGESDLGPDGSLLGTPAYLAPERLDGGPVSPATDVYALGVLLYRALTGHLPWRAASTTQILRAHKYADPIPIPPSDGLPELVVELCQRCLARQPDDRPSSAEVAAELAGVLAGAQSSVRPAASLVRAAATAGTTILPRSLSLAFSGSRSRSSSVRQRAVALLVGAGLMVLTGLIWSTTTRSSGGGAGVGAAAAQPTPSAAAACEVRYALRRDSGTDFHADVTVTNAGPQAVEGWRLTFTLPGDQRLVGGASARVVQAGREVSVRPPVGHDTIPPGGSAALGLAGSYRGANPLPVAFALDGEQCTAVVSAPKPKDDD